MTRRRRLTALFALCAAFHGTANASDAPLVEAAKTGDLTGLERMLGDTDVDQASVDGTTALHWAVYRNDAAMVDRLLDVGATPAPRNRYGIPPLNLAAVNGNARVVERLLAAGADPNTNVPGGETVLMTASRTGDAAAIGALLHAGADANAINDAAQTALMWAAAANNAAAVAALVTGGADPNIAPRRA